MKKLLFVLAVLSLTSCTKTSTDCSTNASLRKGAYCNDGTYTTATGSGACSGHGGVKNWDCK